MKPLPDEQNLPQTRIQALKRLLFADGICKFFPTIWKLKRDWGFPIWYTTLFFLRRFGFYGLEAAQKRLDNLQRQCYKSSPASKKAHAILVALRGRHVSTRGYVIWGETYSRNSAGLYCLHRLCNDLNERGICAVLAGDPYPPAENLVAPVVTRHQARQLVKHGFIAVYPEIVRGNPFHAKHVVRWCLNRPGLLGGDRVYAATEKVFSYARAFVPYIQSPLCGKLYLPTIDEDLFFDNGVPAAQRALVCYYTGKTGYKPGFVNPNTAFEITRTRPSRTELGKLFRLTRLLYSFDCTTILIQEALLCGCHVVLIPDGTQSKEDFTNSEFGDAGISWYGEPESTETDTAKLTRQRLDEIRRNYSEDLTRFIELTLPREAWDEKAFSPHA